LPCDTLPSLEAERGLPMTVGRSSRLDWSALRETIRRHGLRQNAITAISPALEGSVLAGVTPSVEPATRALFGPGLRGTRGAWNRHLVADLKRLLLWNNAMLSELRENEFSVQGVQRIPALIRELYLTQFELDPRCLLECAARRQKWLDLGQSLNLAVTDTRVDSVSEILFLAWEKGLKLTNQLRVPLPPPRPVRPPKEATKPAQPEPVRQQEAVPA
jgi:ribonucleoside-diphosphate reductase alpha chain